MSRTVFAGFVPVQVEYGVWFPDILEVMITCLIIVLGMTHLTASGDVPPEQRRTYVITPEQGEAFCGFYDQAKEIPGGGLNIELDTPWAPNSRFIKKSDIKSCEAETASEREQRVREGISKAGFAYINGNYYDAAEVRLAERAREMARDVEVEHSASKRNHSDDTHNPPGTVVPGDQAEPGFLAQWGFHFGIVLVALGLIGVIIRGLLRG